MSRSVLNLELANDAQTAALGAAIAACVRPGDLIAARGDLGAGKTTLFRALIRALTSPGEEAPSPTFTLVQLYETPLGQVRHFDFYRIRDPSEALEIGFEDAPDAISLVEWPERLADRLPARRLEVELRYNADGRLARLTDYDDWRLRLHGDWRSEP